MLKSLDYKVWLDERELNAGSSPLTAELATAIKNSKVILSCITTDYCKLYVYASAKKKEFKLSSFALTFLLAIILPNELRFYLNLNFSTKISFLSFLSVVFILH